MDYFQTESLAYKNIILEVENSVSQVLHFLIHICSQKIISRAISGRNVTISIWEQNDASV